MKRHAFGFTLIELLIVVAIIAILAAIAVPNFLEAQTRAKVSRAKADQRSLATALESYVIDWNAYPPCNNYGLPGIRADHNHPEDITLERISTPVAYITSAFLNDPFFTNQVVSFSSAAGVPGSPFPEDIEEGPQYTSILYTAWDPIGRCVVPSNAGSFDDDTRPARSWLVGTGGPDRIKISLGGVLANFTADEVQLLIYDPTNGTVSYGDIWRVGGQGSGGDGGPSAPYGAGFQSGVSRNQ